jgi:hypothetical protein
MKYTILTFIVTDPNGKQYSTACPKLFRFPLEATKYRDTFIEQFKREEREYFEDFEGEEHDDEWNDYFQYYTFNSNVAQVDDKLDEPSDVPLPPLTLSAPTVLTSCLPFDGF